MKCICFWGVRWQPHVKLILDWPTALTVQQILIHIWRCRQMTQTDIFKYDGLKDRSAHFRYCRLRYHYINKLYIKRKKKVILNLHLFWFEIPWDFCKKTHAPKLFLYRYIYKTLILFNSLFISPMEVSILVDNVTDV